MELGTAMRSVYDDDAGGSFYCRFGLDAMQAGSGRSMRGERGKARPSPEMSWTAAPWNSRIKYYVDRHGPNYG
jgi:hypothetical protein